MFCRPAPAEVCGDSILKYYYERPVSDKENSLSLSPDTTMASLGPQVWKPQVILAFFLLLLLLCWCWLWEALATDFLW